MRILLSGYFGFGNTGDEMIHAVLKERLLREGFKISSLVKTPVNNEEIYRTHLKEIYSAIKSSDVVISGGGGLIQDKTSSKSFLYYLSILWLAKKLGKKSIVLAQGIGPVEKTLNKRLLKHVMNIIDLVIVRDNHSKEVLLECGVTREISVTADLAFLYPSEEYAKPKEEYVLISFGKHKTNPSIELHAKIIEYIKNKINLPVLLLPLFPSIDTDIMKKISELTEVKLAITSSMDKTISAFNNSVFVIGTRYHSLVISTMKQIPSLGLSYDPKVVSLAGEIAIPVLPYNDSLKLNEFAIAFEKAFSEREITKNRLKNEFIKLKERAEENFKLLYDAILD